MLEAFRDGGWGMIPTFICGVLTVIVALRYAIKPEKRFMPLIISLNAMTLIAGALGFTTGLIATARFLAQDELKQPAIALLGAGESLNNIALALIMMMLAAIATTIGSFRRARVETV